MTGWKGLESASAVLPGCCAVLLAFGVGAAVVCVSVGESAGCWLLVKEACAVVIAMSGVVTAGGRVDRRILSMCASCALRPLCGRPRSRQSLIMVDFRAVSRSTDRNLSDGDDIFGGR